jgi:hypothetical protein
MVQHYHRGDGNITIMDAQAIILAQYSSFLACLDMDCLVISNTLGLDPSSYFTIKVLSLRFIDLDVAEVPTPGATSHHSPLALSKCL